MSTDDQQPDGASGQGSPEINPDGSSQNQNGGSLDDIQDIEELRSKAKALEAEATKNRKIIERHKEKGEQPAQPVAPPTNMASKDDLARMVTNQAKEKASQEVREKWDDLMKIPLGGYDPLDASSIAKNMEQRLLIFKQQNPDKQGNPAAPLQTSSGTQGSASAPAQPAPTVDLPNYRRSVDPSQWYNKPKS